MQQMQSTIDSHQQTAAQVRQQREQSRPLVSRRWDWNCSCRYYVYGDKERCPKCGKHRSQGADCEGVRFRTTVSGRELLPGARAGAGVKMSAVNGNGTTSAHIHGQSSRGAIVQPQPLQTMARQQRVPIPPTYRVQQPSQAVHVVSSKGPQPQRTVQTNACGQLAKSPAILPVGNVTHVQRDAVLKGAEATVRHDIFSQDEENQLGHDPEMQDEDPEATVEELADSITDPNRVWSRMSSVKKAIGRRSKRVGRSKEEVVEQQQILDAARAELEARLATLAQAEADLQSFENTHAELSRRYAELTAAAARQPQEEKQQQCDLDVAGRTQQVLWDMASSLRGLGTDPRIEQAIVMLHSLFNEAGATAAAVAEHAQSDPPPPAALVHTQLAASVPTATHNVDAPAITPSAAPVALHSSSPATPAICRQCWSIACRCRPCLPGDAAPVVHHHLHHDIEVDLERGKKRTCVEAELPPRSAGGQQSLQALLVDSEGQPATSDSTGEQNKCEPQTVEVVPAPSTAAPEPEGDGDSKLAVQPSPTAAPARDQNVVEGGDKEESRSSFAALVKVTCAQRAYPY